METKLIIIFGAPGSGKGYLGDCIVEEMSKAGVNDILYISTGDLLRSEIKQQTPLGKEIEHLVTTGKLVPDNLVSELVMKALCEPNEIKILDGFPRTYWQMSDLIEATTKLNYKVISIKRETEVELIKERVSKRRVCASCKATHSIDDGCCPKCGGVSIIRKDDAVIDTRLEEYQKNTAPLWDDISRFASCALTVNGAIDAKDVAKDFANLLITE